MVAELKKNFPELGIMTDIALDPYTSHGQDGLVDASGYPPHSTSVPIGFRIEARDGGFMAEFYPDV